MAGLSQPPRDERLIVGITGRIGSGKTSVGKYLTSARGFQYLRYSQVLSDWLASDPERKARLQEVGWEVMAGGMQPELNRRLLAQIKPHSDVAVDGLRHPLDYESLNSYFPSTFHLLYIHTPRNVRWSRLKGKGRYTSLDIFEAADSHPVEQQIDSLRENASLVIQNEGSLQDLYAVVDKAICNFQKEGRT